MSNRAVAIIAGATLLVGVLIGRASATDGDTGTAQAPPAVSKSGVDPTSYPRTQEGAATAGQAYDDLIVRAGLMTAEERRAVIEAISTDSMREQVTQSAEEGAQVYSKLFDLPKDQGQVVSRTAPLGWRVTSFTKDSARVELWSVSVFGKPGVDHGIVPQFNTSTFDLAWERGAWRLAGTPQSKDGPTPTADSSQASSDVLAAVNGLRGFSHVAR